MFFERYTLAKNCGIRQKIVAMALLCLPLSLANAQVIGADLAADISVNAGNSQKNKKTAIFPLASTVFSISDELQFKPGRTTDQNNYIAKAEFWSKGAWGVSGNIQQNTSGLFGLPKDSGSKRFDINRKILRTQNSESFLAFGFGWQSLNLEGGAIESDGLNLSLLGKYAFTENFNFYGNGSLFQSLDNNEFQDDVVGIQVEAGVSYQLASRLSFTAGFKISDLEAQQNSRQDRSFSSSFLIGTSLSF